MTKTLPVSVRLPLELKESLKELAKADRRSLSAYIELVLERHVAGVESQSHEPMQGHERDFGKARTRPLSDRKIRDPE